MTGRNAVRRRSVLRALMRPHQQNGKGRKVKIPTPLGELTGTAALLYWREILNGGQADPPADSTVSTFEDEDPFYTDPAELDDPGSFDLTA